MKKTLTLMFVSLALVLSACGRYQAPQSSNPTPAQPATGAVRHPLEDQVAGIQPALIARYHRIISHDDGSKETYAKDFKYQPRQSEFAGYESWDMLATPWPWAADANNFIYLSLNRDARLVIALDEWQNDKAVADKSLGALSSWTKGMTTGEDERGNPRNYVTYTKDFAKGDVALPAIKEIAYLVLLAEKDGVPSAEPLLPAGITERPEANKTCPSWLSDNVWVTQGPDQNIYKTWQPQIDPVYWCYYRHDHGSDPSLVGYKPAFGYVAVYNKFQPELHEGFKGFAIRDEEKGIGWYINIHSETGVISRACARVHTVVMAATDLKSGEKLLELSYKGDFGVVVGNGESGDATLQPGLKDCPNQAQIAGELETNKFDAKRRLRVFSGGKDPGGYEQWDGGASRDLGMSFPDWFPGMGIDIRNPATGCSDSSCTDVGFTGQHADQRTIEFRELNIVYDNLLDKSDGKAGDGFFRTDVYGIVNDDDTQNVIVQYVKPGFEQTLDGFFSSQDSWRGLYTEGHHVPGFELEEALTSNN
jgi:hypothetical protein